MVKLFDGIIAPSSKDLENYLLTTIQLNRPAI